MSQGPASYYPYPYVAGEVRSVSNYGTAVGSYVRDDSAVSIDTSVEAYSTTRYRSRASAADAYTFTVSIDSSYQRCAGCEYMAYVITADGSFGEYFWVYMS